MISRPRPPHFRLRTFAAMPRGVRPLSHPANTPHALPPVAGVIFDVDGTLTVPQPWMFVKMRAAIGISRGVDILTHVSLLPDAVQRTAAMDTIREIEREAMEAMVPQQGLVQVMEYLQTKGIRKGILTRNNEDPVTHLLTKHLPHHLFKPIVTRTFEPPKPHPAGILHIAREWGLPNAKSVIMVGDSMDDMAAGHAAGAVTVLLVNEENRLLVEAEETDIGIERLDELINLLESGVQVKEQEELPD